MICHGLGILNSPVNPTATFCALYFVVVMKDSTDVKVLMFYVLHDHRHIGPKKTRLNPRSCKRPPIRSMIRSRSSLLSLAAACRCWASEQTVNSSISDIGLDS